MRLAGPETGPASLDPALSRDLATNQLVRQVFRGLMRFDVNVNAVPALAAEVQVDAEGRIYRFRLRDDAVFHDGRPVTATDVVDSLSRALDPAIAGGDASRLASPTYLADIVGAADLLAGRASRLAGATAVDERTVEVALTAPRATFLMKLASVPAAIVDTGQAAADAEWWRAPNGTGPFRVAAWEPEALLTLEALPVYLGETSALSRVEILLGPSASLPFNLYQAGEIDLLESVPGKSVAWVRDPASALAGTLLETPLFAVSYVAFGNQTSPYDDVNLRRALRLAFPTRKIAEVSEAGTVDVATGIVPRGMLGRDWATDRMEPDLDAARRAIAASGFGSPEEVPPLPIYCADPDPVEALRDVLAGQLGLRIEVIQVNWPDFLGGLAARLFPAYALYWGADYPDPESILWMLFGSDSPDNYTGYRHAELDALLAEAAGVADSGARAPLYQRAQEVLLDDGAMIPFYFDIAYTLVRPEVAGVEVTALGILGFERVRVER
ncbi:MAG: peptide ABC transporter substrate-binding protein, partial [Chloroflexia bacterium]|nr:peptide ABC transporter substrate-binding protein [Chloroflexia bacterium]